MVSCYLNAPAGSLLRVHHDGLHVLAEHLGDGHVVALMSRLAHVDHTVVLRTTTYCLYTELDVSD